MKSFVAVSALAALATAMPHAKRDIVWVTATDVVTEVVDVTETVWVNGADATASPVQNAPHNHADYHKQTQTTVSSVVVPSSAPSSSPSSAPSVAVQPVVTSTTSVYVAPSPTTTPQTTAAPSPAPVAQYTSSPSPVAQSSAAPAAQSSAPAAYSAPASSGGSGGGNGCSGTTGTCNDAKFTYYTPGMGSCGMTNTDSDYIFAYGSAEMAAAGGANPNDNPLCGRQIAIKAYDGSEITATLRDTCVACSGKPGMLDLTTGLWNRIAQGMPGANGVLNDMEYRWL